MNLLVQEPQVTTEKAGTMQHAIQLGAIETFCKAAEFESFTRAAEALGITAAAVSRAIGRLEDRLGLQLFARTTRRMRLTDHGRIYYEQCRQALTQIEETERAITGQQVVPTGLLRISLPTTYAHYRVIPLLAKFRQRYPEVVLEVDVSNRNIDFIQEGYDLAIRLGEPKDSRLVARKLEDASLGVFASAAYLRGIKGLKGKFKGKTEGKKPPTTLAGLRQLDLIQFVLPSTGRGMPWIFHEDGQDVDFAFTSGLRFQDDVLGCVTAARAGAGVFQIYHFIAAPYVATGELVEMMAHLVQRTRPFFLLYPSNRHLSAKVRAFVDFLISELRA
jgi:DNA-binding transcriptional LysR family regulator